MGADKIRYLIFMRNRWRYKPSKEMEAHGFRFLTLGPGHIYNGKPVPSTNDQARAIGLNREWDAIRTSIEPASPRFRYPPGSVGDGYDRAMALRRAEREKNGVTWTKEHHSRDDWPRAWKWLEPYFGDIDPRTIQPEHFLSFDPESGEVRGLIAKIEQRVSISERHRVIKVWRALWKRMASMGYCDKDKDPSLTIANSAPKPRQAEWREGEVVRLCKNAWRHGYRGLAALMATAWDSQLSPIDARTLQAGQRAQSNQGAVFFLDRAKTGRAAAGTLGSRATALLDAYLESLGLEMLDMTPIFRTRGYAPGPKGGKPHAPKPYSKNTLVDDFAFIRQLTFGPLERRQLADMRRSGTVEAFAGGASVEDVSAKMANTLSASTRLQKTYNPVNLVAVREVDEHRKIGRAKLREQRPHVSVTRPARKL